MKSLVASITLLAVIAIVMGQERYAIKPGSCPPALPIQFCERTCYVDADCLGPGKCCPTRCGGHICSMFVTDQQRAQTKKPGSCPTVPTGRWVCSSTCNSDNDCRGTLKCCKNRCGALTCQKPEIEPIESEIPIEPVVPRFRFDY